MQSIVFASHNPDACCLCGDTRNLTGEHKLKRSIVSAEFGTGTKMAIGRFSEPGFRYAQGPKSKLLHFESKLCAECNGARTQSADREFHSFQGLTRDLLQKGQELSNVLSGEDYPKGSEKYLNVFRYFAKILCCHIAEVGGPRPVPVARFAIGRTRKNPIFLRIGRDPFFEIQKAETANTQFASHSGLTIFCGRSSGWPNGFKSALTFGPVQFEFWTKMHLIGRLELRFFFSSFSKLCRQIALQAHTES